MNLSTCIATIKSLKPRYPCLSASAIAQTYQRRKLERSLRRRFKCSVIEQSISQPIHCHRPLLSSSPSCRISSPRSNPSWKTSASSPNPNRCSVVGSELSRGCASRFPCRTNGDEEEGSDDWPSDSGLRVDNDHRRIDLDISSPIDFSEQKQKQRRRGRGRGREREGKTN